MGLGVTFLLVLVPWPWFPVDLIKLTLLRQKTYTVRSTLRASMRCIIDIIEMSGEWLDCRWTAKGARGQLHCLPLRKMQKLADVGIVGMLFPDEHFHYIQWFSDFYFVPFFWHISSGTFQRICFGNYGRLYYATNNKLIYLRRKDLKQSPAV